ncbi:MAG: hypothetical protein KDD45_14495 [Bdellovibrionales bacterium]|nr:hypothetical protein [Bdellovibrionales bacterium]
MKDFIDIFKFCDPVSNKLVFLVEPLDVFKLLFYGFMVDFFVGVFRLETILKRAFNEGMSDFNLLLHIFGDGVPEGSEFHINFDDILMRQS